MAEDKGVSIDELKLNELKELHFAFESDVVNIWDYERSVESRNAYGGTSLNGVSNQILELQEWIELSKK